MVQFEPSSEIVSRASQRTRLGEEAYCFAADVGADRDLPRSFNEAVQDQDRKQWEKAIKLELDAHALTRIWEVVERTRGMRVNGRIRVFAFKRNEHGELVLYKAHLVALGYGQEFGINYFETYAPVANMNAIRVSLAMCATLGYVVMQFNVDTAFLYAVLHEEVLILVPDGVTAPQGSLLKLLKSLYGLKQASLEWNKTIDKVLKDIGFEPTSADPCVYVMVTQRSELVYLCLYYVDDLLVGAQSRDAIDLVKQQLQASFRLKELSVARYILGMQITQQVQRRETSIAQTQYIADIAERFGQSACKPVYNPVKSSLKIGGADASQFADERDVMQSKSYRSVIGCLLYVATCTRLDVSFAVSHLSRYVENPSRAHWNAALQVLRYLWMTRDFGVGFSGGDAKDVKLKAWCGSDWAANPDDWRSVFGVVVLVASGPVAYMPRAQSSVALSSCEAKIMTVSLAAQETVWTRSAPR